MGFPDKISTMALSLVSTFLLLAVVVRIFSMLPEDDNSFDGYAVVFIFFGWVAFCLLGFALGYFVARFSRVSARPLPCFVWCIAAVVAFISSNIDHKFNNPSTIVWLLTGALICSAPLIAVWAWSKKFTQSEVPVL